ncbi:hypothetical protein ACIQCH_15740, partial [Streptomyces sp. NPDC093225]
MRDDQGHPRRAHTDLCTALKDGLAGSPLNVTELARVVALGRTTVSQAFNVNAEVPSAHTVAALARALKLPAGPLLELRRKAIGSEFPTKSPGRPIGEWDPHDLEVHPAGPSLGAPVSGPQGGMKKLPGYVRRDHDRVLEEAVRDAAAGRSRMVILVGGSSTGKTRACWEAVQPLADQAWRLWHPFDPTRAEAAMADLHQVGPHTVVWLNEAQHYLGNRTTGERIAAAIHHLLVDPGRAPVLVLGTIWPEYALQYAALAAGVEDPHSRARELLKGHSLTVPDAFDPSALAEAAALAKDGDGLLADALERASGHGRVTQDLAGAPELLDRYHRATPAARALLEAAMDARRLGVGLHLPQPFLTGAAPDYLIQSDYDQLADGWVERAYTELAAPVHGMMAPLRRTVPRPQLRPSAAHPPSHAPATTGTGPVFRLADYLEQHGRTSRRHMCPPATFWHSAHAHLTRPDDLDNLSRAAEQRHRLQWAHHLRCRATDHDNTNPLNHQTWTRTESEGEEGTEALARLAADRNDVYALARLAEVRQEAGDVDGAEALARLAADRGGTY